MAYKKFIVAADNHGGLVCEAAKKKFLAFADDWKPHHRIHLGDLWDFSPLRRGASPEEKADGISDDYQCGLDFLDVLVPGYGAHYAGSEHAGERVVADRLHDLDVLECAKRALDDADASAW
jgi:hypothetical protein